MSSIKIKNYRNWPIALKMVFNIAILIIFVVIMVGVGSYLIYRNGMLQVTQQMVPQTLNQANKNIESYVDEIINLSSMILKTPDYDSLVNILHLNDESADRPEFWDTYELDKFLRRNYSMRNSKFINMILYTNSNYAYVRDIDGGYWVEASYKDQLWYKKIKANNFAFTMIGTIKDQFLTGNPMVFSFAQPILDPRSGEVIGIFQVSGRLDYIRDILKYVNLGDNSLLYVVDKENDVVYSSNNAELGEAWESKYDVNPGGLSFDQGYSIINNQDGKFLVSYSKSIYNGCTIISVIPFSELTKGTVLLAKWAVIFMLVGIVFAIILSTVFAYGISNPIRQLGEQLKQFGDNNYMIKPVKHNDDEIGQLWDKVEQMAEKIRFLITEVLHNKLMKQEIQISALVNQINPHFMCNTIETIRMIMKKGDYVSSEEGLIALGNILRYHITQFQDLVPIKKEMDFVLSFLYIQKLRLGNNLLFEYKIDRNILDKKIPVLTIQPLVENSIRHGLVSDRPLQIIVEICIANDYLLCKVIDDGKGMEQDELDDLISSIHDEKIKDKNIALANIFQRIKIIYHEKADFQIWSEKDAGTAVNFRIPLSEAKEAG